MTTEQSDQMSQAMASTPQAQPLALQDISQQSESPHTATGYEPNITGALPSLGVPPIGVMAGGLDAMLNWYLSQHANLANRAPVPQGSAAASGVHQP